MASTTSTFHPTYQPGTPARAPVIPISLFDIDLGDLRARLLGLYPSPEVAEVLNLDVPEQAPLLAIVDAIMPPSRLPPNPDAVDTLVDRMLDVTVAGQALDPGQFGSDIPWAVAVGRLLTDAPAIARQVAGTYALHLDRLAVEDDHVAHPVVFSVGAYLVAGTELVLGRTVRASRWALEADAHVEHEAPGVSLAAYVRAMALLDRGRCSEVSMEKP